MSNNNNNNPNVKHTQPSVSGRITGHRYGKKADEFSTITIAIMDDRELLALADRRPLACLDILVTEKTSEMGTEEKPAMNNPKTINFEMDNPKTINFEMNPHVTPNTLTGDIVDVVNLLPGVNVTITFSAKPFALPSDGNLVGVTVRASFEGNDLDERLQFGHRVTFFEESLGKRWGYPTGYDATDYDDEADRTSFYNQKEFRRESYRAAYEDAVEYAQKQITKIREAIADRFRWENDARNNSPFHDVTVGGTRRLLA